MHGDRVVLAARLMQLAAKLGGMVLCDEDTHDATCDDIRFVRLRPNPDPNPNPNPNPNPDPTPDPDQVRLRPVNIKGKVGPYQPYRPVASSKMLEKPTLRDLSEREYHQVSS